MAKKYVIVDIDGTISKVGDRLKYLKKEKPDWDSFYEHCDEDEPIIPICNLVDKIDVDNLEVIFCTGRRESVRVKTVEWINTNVYNDKVDNTLISECLLMRKDGDWRHDTEVKPELLRKAGIELKDISFVIEDRNSMVKKWREMGLICLQPADGEF